MASSTVKVTSGDGRGVGQGKGLSGSKYAQSKKALMATINEIRSTGAAVDVDLPTIVVAGNQSSGKSSLIEAISGINLPRAVGTCTRVPIEVRLRQDNVEWSCIIKVRREGSDQEDDGRKPEVPFGKPIIDPTLVESSIRRAQLGILNPSVQLERFVSYALPEEEDPRPLGSEKQHAFSKDVIVLEITGPDQTDLTLVDLPGIIQNVGENEDPGNIQLIENMVRSYISKDCLILLVITMKDDIQNQKAALLAREADPNGKRTIGVLTKVDTLQGRSETEFWLKVVQNQRDKLTHGYYPNADELAAGISFSDAREQEDAFFQKQTPWKDLDRQFKKRLGTKNLAMFLSDQLSFFIKTKLPELEKQIGDRHREIDSELRKLGKEPTDDPINALLSLVTSFELDILKNTDGAPDYARFMQSFNALSKAFKVEIEGTRPKFLQKERKEAGGPDAAIRDREGLEIIMADPKLPAYLDDMRLHIQSCRTRELPNQTPQSACDKLIKRSTADWDEIALNLLEEVKPVVKILLDDLIRDSFGKYTYGGLPGSVGTIVDDQLAVLFKNAQDQIRKFVAMERRPYTQNDHYLDTNTDKYLAQFKSLKRKRGEEGEATPTTVDKAEKKKAVSAALAHLAMAGQPGVTEEDLRRLQKPDEYETELDLMARTCAYWQVALKRVIDNIPRCIDTEFLEPLSKTIKNALINELKVFGEDAQARCKEYLDEAPDVAEHRKDLTVRKARLGDAKVALRRFKM